MPKVNISTFPVSGLFGVAKPSGPTCMSIVNDLQQLIARSRLFVDAKKINHRKIDRKKGKLGREAVKVGQGGTLDPLADGVLVIGVGKGTKRLNEFLNCTKEYRTTCLLGCETDSYDSEGARVRLAPWRHVTQQSVEAILPKFTGQIQQVPPIFSALKMDGIPLYDYARKGIPLPRPIEPRGVTVQSLTLTKWLDTEHSFSWPDKEFSSEEKEALQTALKGISQDPILKDDPKVGATDEKPSAFVLDMSVSGGTYVRSIVHDLGHSLGSAGHVVTLTRTRQGRFVLDPVEDEDHVCIPWEVFETALKAHDGEERDEEGLAEWERQVMQHLEIV